MKMKKIIALFAACLLALVSTVALAQSEGNTDSKKSLHPKAGDIGVGIEASPILKYVGNMFNGKADNDPADYWTNRTEIYLRYFLFDDAAIRARLSIKSSRIENTFHPIDDAARFLDPLSNKKVEDKHISKDNSWEINAGYQMFRGEGRLRGFYGGELHYRFAKTSDEYLYGNKMNEANPTPTTEAAPYVDGDARLLLRSGDPTHSIGLNVFTGVEFYFMPRACLGFEVGMGFNASVSGMEKRELERMTGSEYTKIEKTTEAPNSSVTFGTSTPQLYSNFYFMFHF